MKFNLKNRPKRMHGNMDRAMYSTKEVNEWFEGFEKELQEMLDKAPDMAINIQNIPKPVKDAIKTSSTGLLTFIINEILGDS